MSYAEHFWRWVYGLASAKLRAVYVAKTGWDLKCPNCKCWSSVAGIKLESYSNTQRRYRCEQCEQLTAWQFDGPVAFPVPTVYFNQSKGGQS